MNLKKCDICELNYINLHEERCQSCTPKTTDHNLDRKTFQSMGLDVGQEIFYIHDPKIKVKITGERTVLFEGKEWYTTPLVAELYKRAGKNPTIGSGFECFKIDDHDKNLYLRWERMNKTK